MRAVMLLLLLLCISPAAADEQVLFAAGKDGYHTYRIPALAVTAKNARRLGAAERVSPVRTDLTDGLDLSRFDLAVSNPPYVDRSEIPQMSVEVCNFEPQLALFPPGSGDSVLARLFARCAELRSGVALIVEIGRGQLDAARRHAEASGLDLVRVRHDYSGIPRVLVLRRL